MKSTLLIKERTTCCSQMFSLNSFICCLSACIASASCLPALQNGLMIWTMKSDANFFILSVVDSNLSNNSTLLYDVKLLDADVALLGVLTPFCSYCYFIMLFSYRKRQSISVGCAAALFSSPWSSYWMFLRIKRVMAIMILSRSSSLLTLEPSMLLAGALTLELYPWFLMLAKCF